MIDSIITPEALDRCAAEAERREHINALRTLEHARARKRIDDFYDAWVLSGASPVNRRVIDRRLGHTWEFQRPLVPIMPRVPPDMEDVDRRLAAD